MTSGINEVPSHQLLYSHIKSNEFTSPLLSAGAKKKTLADNIYGATVKEHLDALFNLSQNNQHESTEQLTSIAMGGGEVASYAQNLLCRLLTRDGGGSYDAACFARSCCQSLITNFSGCVVTENILYTHPKLLLVASAKIDGDGAFLNPIPSMIQEIVSAFDEKEEKPQWWMSNKPSDGVFNALTFEFLKETQIPNDRESETRVVDGPLQHDDVPIPITVGRLNSRTGSKSVPDFKSHFNSASIGIENELSGLVVVLPNNSAPKFGYVHDADGNPLFMLTKDMNQGGYTNPMGITDTKGINQWLVHTIELVSYPCEIQDSQAVEARKDAMLWLAREFTQHINQTNHNRLSDMASEDGRFKLVISNTNHVIAAGNGVSRDGHGQTIGMTQSGQQATMAVRAREFGTGASQEIRLLESAPWYHPELKELFLSNTANVKLEDAATAQNVFAYLSSIYCKTADLAREYGIYINEWDPASEGVTPKAKGLTDPKVKNAWEILPRTKPIAILALLSSNDKRVVSDQILATLKSACSLDLAQNIYNYFKFGGEVAGHGINNATTGDSKYPEPAILFEFRQVPNELSSFVPKTESTASVEVKALDQFNPISRRTIVVAVNTLVEQSSEFDRWYQDYRESKGLKSVQYAKKVASAYQKAEWVMSKQPEEWSRITAGHLPDNT